MIRSLFHALLEGRLKMCSVFCEKIWIRHRERLLKSLLQEDFGVRLGRDLAMKEKNSGVYAIMINAIWEAKKYIKGLNALSMNP